MLEVVEPGALATVQDVVERHGHRRYGVPSGGCADPWSARLANRLVGNPDEAALIEVTAGGASLRLSVAAVVAVTGGLEATVDGVSLHPRAGRRLPAGVTVRIDPGPGLRAYVAVAGGIDVEPILGSRSTNVAAAFGGWQGRPLRPGDRVPLGDGGARVPHRWAGSSDIGPLKIVPGPHASDELLDALVATGWRVGQEADRVGVRLDGPAPEPVRREVPSMGLVSGAIQVPPDGRPIVMLADRPVTGGYPVPAVVIGADIGRAAQLRPGDAVPFVVVTEAAARLAWRRTWNGLAAVEALDAPDDDEPAWAGSHE